MVIFFGSLIPINLSTLNPFKKGLEDYEFTDLIYSKFKSDIDFDDRIIIINVGKPDRSKIANCISKLTELEAKAIGVDVIFEEFNGTPNDSLLLQVIQKNDRLVLGDEFEIHKPNKVPHVCHSNFCNENNIGYTNFVAKPNYSIRYFSPSENHEDILVESLSTAIVKKTDQMAYHKLMARKNSIEKINYRGSSDSYVQIEMDDFLSSMDMKPVVQDKVILLGYTGQDQWSESSLDKYFTPLNNKFTKKAKPDMFGVFVHANIISMILDGNYINNSPAWFNYIFAFVIIFLLVGFLRSFFLRINPGYFKLVRIIQLTVFFLLFVLSTFLYFFFNYKIGINLALLGVVLSWDMVKIYQHIFIKRQKFFKAKI